MATSALSKIMPSSWPSEVEQRRIGSIDLLRGIVMLVMALDHVRDYFHYDAFLHDPSDLSHTSIWLFFTRFITHFCAPAFVFLAGISAYLHGVKMRRSDLSYYLFTRGLWLVFAELFIVTLAWTFNPSYPFFNLQVIWAIGISMIALSAVIHMRRRYILLMGVLLIVFHNLLDKVHVRGSGLSAFLWSVLHEPRDFTFSHLKVFVRYPVLPWMGIMMSGYFFGGLYTRGFSPVKRRKSLLNVGTAAVAAFILLRAFNFYGDPAQWAPQETIAFSLLSFLKITKYPPSLLYILLTIGPAMILLALTEKPLNSISGKLAVFGRVPFFYYVVHLYLIHLIAVIAAGISGYHWSDMILSDRINRVVILKGYGFSLSAVYTVWICLVILLYPCCKWFDYYKRTHQSDKRWLTYL